MTSLEMQSRMIQPSVHFHVSRRPSVLDNVDDFSYVGHEENFKRLSRGLVEKLEITKTIADEDHAHEVKYLDVLTCGATVFFKV